MIVKRITILFISLLVFGCNSPEDVDPVERNTFVKFFGNSLNNTGNTVINTDNGFILLGTSTSPDSTEQIDLILTDNFGNAIWEKTFLSAEAAFITKLSDGYLIIGDSIKTIDDSESVSMIYVLKTNFEGDLIDHTTIGDPSDDELDYHGRSLVVNDNGDIVIIGERENAEDLDETVVIGLDGELNTLWQQVYSQNNRNLRVGKSIHFQNSSRLVWATTSLAFTDDDNTLSDSYISLPIVGVNTEQINSNDYGRNAATFVAAKDIYLDNSGIAVVGSSNENGSNDIFFIKASSSGFFSEHTATTISTTMDGNALSGADEALTLTQTSDGGYVILSSISTTPEIGNGEKDIYLLKVTNTGTPIWESIIGGAGSEIGSSIIEADDGGLIINGTQVLQGASMQFLIKTNSKGKLIEE